MKQRGFAAAHRLRESARRDEPQTVTAVQGESPRLSRGMNPTTAETTRTGRIVDCATESRVRICTPARR